MSHRDILVVRVQRSSETTSVAIPMCFRVLPAGGNAVIGNLAHPQVRRRLVRLKRVPILGEWSSECIQRPAGRRDEAGPCYNRPVSSGSAT